MGEDLGETKLYIKPVIKWYKKLWYIITFRKNKLPKSQELKVIHDLTETINVEEMKK